MVEMSLSNAHMSSSREGQHNNNIELYICMRGSGSRTYIHIKHDTEPARRRLPDACLVHPVVCTSATKVCIGGSSTCSNHGR